MTDLSRRGFLGGAAKIGAGVAAVAVISPAVIETATKATIPPARVIASHSINGGKTFKTMTGANPKQLWPGVYEHWGKEIKKGHVDLAKTLFKTKT